MKRNRIVILTGAGAVVDWEGPQTSDLTKLIRKTGFYCNDNKTLITEYIYQALVKSGYDEKDINFETIINVIEDLVIYYSSFDVNKKTPSLLKVFFNSSFEEILLNFSIEGGVVKHGFRLEIPKGKKYEFQHGAIANETPAQFFFQLLLAELLTQINCRISNYAYHRNDEFTKIITEGNAEINSLFFDWLKKIRQNGSILRFYTLNYDRSFKVLALRSGMNEVFEGFECDESVELGTTIAANISRIISDFDCDCHYNLHGSAFWIAEPRDKFQLLNPELCLQSSPFLPMNLPEQPFIQIEKGKSILISNIVTGYQKAQKGYFPPLKQMQSAFDTDCILADIFYIIGYSFGDEHINMSIKTALKYNSNIKICIVDPAYDERDGKMGYELLKQKFIDVFAFYLNDFTAQKNSKFCNEYFDGRIVVYSIGLKEFLTFQKNT